MFIKVAQTSRHECLTDSQSSQCDAPFGFVSKAKKLVSLSVLVILLLAIFPSIACANQQLASKFFELEKQFQQATTKAQFVEVATGYEALKSSGPISPSVLFNQANAWFKAEEYGRAIAGYRQALRLSPSDDAIRSNLKLAIEKAGHEMEGLSLIQYAFFWNQSLTLPALAKLITFILLIAATLFLLNQKSSASQIFIRVLAAMILILIASFAVKVNEQQLTNFGVVTVDSADAKKGPAASYESAFSSPLTDGREFTVVQQKQDWIEVEIPGIGRGWLPKSDAVVY